MTPGTSTPSISVVINTWNAVRYLDLAIDSVREWADEVLVADMGSNDGTVALAQARGARVLPVERDRYVEPARQAAVSAALGDWILILDADEIVEPLLADELRRVITQGGVDAVWLRRRNYLLGQRVSHSAWETDRQLRFHRRGAVAYSSQIHSQPTPKSDAVILERTAGCIVHFAYAGVDDFLQRLDRYTSVEAESLLRAGARPSVRRAVGGVVREMGGRYVVHRGYRHGWVGLTLGFLMAVYRVVIEAKVAQLRDAGPSEQIVEQYRSIGRSILSDE